MRVLLDTHCWLWAMANPDALNADARATFVDPNNDLFLSAASAWEIAIKWSLGKLELPLPPSDYVSRRIAEHGVAELPIAHTHALRVASLPAHHRDPFDRLLIAQAQIEGCRLMTADACLRAYEVDLLWAGA